METTIYQEEILEQVMDDLRSRYAGYHIAEIREFIDEDIRTTLLEDGVWHGNYDHFGVSWDFTLEKLSGDWKGPRRLHVSVHPVFDVVFADVYPTVFSIEVVFKSHPDKAHRPEVFRVDEVDSEMWNLAYFYNAHHRDL